MKWIDNKFGSGVHCNLTHTMELHVYWDAVKEGGYLVSVFGSRLKEKFKDLEEAKCKAISFANSILDKAKIKLNNDEK